MLNAIPSWADILALVLVWPSECGRAVLVDGHAKFILALPAEQKVLLVLRADNEKKKEKIRRTLQNRRGVDFIVLPTVKDIWICDWAPLQTQSEGNRIGMKTTYNPRYLGVDPTFASGDDTAGLALMDKCAMDSISMPIVLDGGNFTHNGNGIAIVTERIREDNHSYSDAELRELFQRFLGIDKLLIIAEEPGDETGHVDGFVRFISPSTLAIASYPQEYEGAAFMDEMADWFVNQLGQAFRIVRIPNGYPPDEIREGISSAVGNYMNFVRLGGTFVMPSYGLPEDRAAIDAISSLDECSRVIATDPASTTKLAALGGVYQCASWPLFSDHKVAAINTRK